MWCAFEACQKSKRQMKGMIQSSICVLCCFVYGTMKKKNVIIGSTNKNERKLLVKLIIKSTRKCEKSSFTEVCHGGSWTWWVPDRLVSGIVHVQSKKTAQSGLSCSCESDFWPLQTYNNFCLHHLNLNLRYADLWESCGINHLERPIRYIPPKIFLDTNLYNGTETPPSTDNIRPTPLKLSVLFSFHTPVQWARFIIDHTAAQISIPS